jgi:hypothetical protein
VLTTYISLFSQTSTIFQTSTVYVTRFSTFFQTSTTFVTTVVTSSNVDVATVTNYVTSTVVAKRSIIEYTANTIGTDSAKRNALVFPRPVASPWLPFADTVREVLEDVGLVGKRAVTSTMTAFSVVWYTESRNIGVTSTYVSNINSVIPYTSTIRSTYYADGRPTTTVFSTLVVTNYQSEGTVIQLPPTTGTVTVPGTGIGSAITPPTSTGAGSGDNGNTGELSVGAKAGVGAGAGIASLALVGGLVFFFLSRRKAREAKSLNSQPMTQAPLRPPTMPSVSPQSQYNDGMRMSGPVGTHQSYISTNSAAGRFGDGGTVSPIDRGASPASWTSDLTGYRQSQRYTREIGTEHMGQNYGNTQSYYETPSQYYYNMNEMPAQNYQHINEMPAQSYYNSGQFEEAQNMHMYRY